MWIEPETKWWHRRLLVLALRLCPVGFGKNKWGRSMSNAHALQPRETECFTCSQIPTNFCWLQSWKLSSPLSKKMYHGKRFPKRFVRQSTCICSCLIHLISAGISTSDCLITCISMAVLRSSVVPTMLFTRWSYSDFASTKHSPFFKVGWTSSLVITSRRRSVPTPSARTQARWFRWTPWFSMRVLEGPLPEALRFSC